MTVSATVEVTLDGTYLINALHNAARHIAGQDLMTSIGLSLKQRNEARHVAETDPDGNPWTPLKPYTIKHKKNPRMLVEEGDMLRLYSTATDNTVTVGTADKKAYWHHAGTRRQSDKGPTRGLPPRPIIGLPEADQQFIVRLLDDHVNAVLTQSGLRP